ncbi:hypothetical protein F5877DRAFT_70381 [Lentinula edodes]|nr:hypothetical protein F5877DRAFT_70381 [Lentinula edodes]
MDPFPENLLPDPAALAQTLKTKQAPLATGIAELLAGQQSIFNALAGMQKQLAQVDRRSACTINQTRGSGAGKPYDEVRFPDNTLPSQPGQGRAPLPMLNNMLDIRALSGEDVTNYLINHGILPENIPHNVTDRRKKLAEIIGCIGYYEEILYYWYNHVYESIPTGTRTKDLKKLAISLWTDEFEIDKRKRYLETRERSGLNGRDVAVVVKKGKGESRRGDMLTTWEWREVKNSKLKFCDEDDDSVDAVGGIDEEAKGPEWEIVQADRDVDVDLDIAPPPPTPVPRPSSVALELPVPPLP